jgi:hypothetical protein
MNGTRSSALRWMAGAFCLSAISLVGGAPAWAQSEKRTVFAPDDFHWHGNLKAGQALEVINRNGEIAASGAAGNEARAESFRRGSDDDRELFIEVVEYPEGVTICAVQAKDMTPGRCHRGGVSSEHFGGWHEHHAKVNFDIQVPRGVRFQAMTTNGNVVGRDLKSVVEATTTNGNVEVSTSEWGSARTTNGGVRISMGNAKWDGELEVKTTNGNVDVSLPASSEFKVNAGTTNGKIHTDFPITVQGSLSSKDLSGTVGGGGRELKVVTTNGTIKLMKS